MKIPFGIKYRPQIESGEYKVETRDGRTVRVVCWDLDKPQEPIIACVKQFDGNESDETFTINGRYWTTGKTCGEDLFIITPEPELTEFEKEICKVSNLELNYEMKEEVRAAAAHVLELARKEIEADKKSFKRLPTIYEWKWLIENCEWKWDDVRKGGVVTAPNGNYIFLPAAGYRDGTSLYDVGSYGKYWSSSLNTDYQGGAYYVYFYSGGVCWHLNYNCHERSVRCVSDTPREGFVDMGNNLFWAERNEEGYFTYDEAMKLFDS